MRVADAGSEVVRDFFTQKGQPLSDIELEERDDDDDEDEQHKGEMAAFIGLGSPANKRSTLCRKFTKIHPVYYLCFTGLLIILFVILIPRRLTTTRSSNSITKVTGLYGSGAWRESEVPDIAAKVPSKTRHSNLQRAVALHQAHAKMYGHKQVVQSAQLFGGRINNAYTKIGNLLEQNLIEMSMGPGKGAKWLFWHDADTIILNRLISLDTFVSDVNNSTKINLICAADFNGLNAGLFFLRVGEWASLFLANVLTRGRPLPGKIDFWEQGAINEVLAKDAYFADAKILVPQDWFNMYPKLDSPGPLEDGFEDTVSPGTFITHQVGDTKFSPGLFTRYLAIAEGTNTTYHSQSAADSLKVRVAAFWKEHTSANGSTITPRLIV